EKVAKDKKFIKKLDDLIKLFSTLNANHENNRTIAYYLNKRLNSVSNLESIFSNIEAFLPAKAFVPMKSASNMEPTKLVQRKRKLLRKYDNKFLCYLHQSCF
ncbi:Hypothetical protein CINCED_3A013720, partial [Cinara cedri]